MGQCHTQEREGTSMRNVGHGHSRILSQNWDCEVRCTIVVGAMAHVQHTGSISEIYLYRSILFKLYQYILIA